MQLTDVEARIIGSLVEKESTTPDNYPLSLNALTTACNQISNRDPVMSLTEDSVKRAVNSLRQQSLVRAIQPADSRVTKFQHLLADKLELDAPELATLCVLLLRGPQTMAEIRTRTARLAEFRSGSDLETAVKSLIARELAVELPRRAGQKETRFAHLLSGPPADAPRAESTDEPPRATVEPPASQPGERLIALESTVENLQRELADLAARFDEFRAQFG
jgi:uncharacterized protein